MAPAAKKGEEEQKATGDDNEPPPIPPKVLAKLAKKKLESDRFIMFIFRKLAALTCQFNIYYSTQLHRFAVSMRAGDILKRSIKKKKNYQPRIWNFQTMNETAKLLREKDNIEAADGLAELLDFLGKMRGLFSMANNLFNYLKKNYEDTEDLQSAKYFLDYWYGFTCRKFDYNTLIYPKNQLPADMPWSEQRYIKWPLAIRTSIYVGCQLVKFARDVAGSPLFPEDPTSIIPIMTKTELVTGYNIDEMITNRAAKRAGMNLLKKSERIVYENKFCNMLYL